MSQRWLVSLETVAFSQVGVNFLIVDYGGLLRIGIHLAKIYYLSKLKFSDGIHEKAKTKRKPHFQAESSDSIPSESRRRWRTDKGALLRIGVEEQTRSSCATQMWLELCS